MKRRSKLFIIILLVLTAAVIVYALFFMGRGVQTSEVSLPSPDQSGETEPSAAPGLTQAVLTNENVQAVLAELSRAESYSAVLTVEDFWPDGSGSQELQVWVDGGSVRLRGSMGGSTRNVLVTGGTLYIWYDSISGLAELPWEGSADRWLRMISYEDVLELPAECITDAGYSPYGGADCIYVEYSDGEDDNYVNRIYVSVSSGLLMGAETYDGGELIYRMTSSVPELSVPDSGLFVPPES